MITPLNTLDIPKRPEETRVVVAMSGGVDSSVVAAWLVEQNYDVIGITLQLYDYGQSLEKKGACCAGQDIHDAKNVADNLGIPHYVLDYESKFHQSVIEDFADTYLAGETPIPCIRCNQTVKFSNLYDTAKELGADCLATGHYIRRAARPDRTELHRAADDTKDQSYFLFATTKEQLTFLRFPLGNLPKSDVRKMAHRFDLPVASKPDSQDICFVPQGSYAKIVERVRPGAGRAGDIVHLDGRVLGQHSGIINYTIGQRRGLGIATGQPLYVVKLDAQARRVIVGPRSALAINQLTLNEPNWLGDGNLRDACLAETEVTVKVRSTQSPVSATLQLINGHYGVTFKKSELGVAKGQAAVLYAPDGVRLLGGGFISETFSQALPLTNLQ